MINVHDYFSVDWEATAENLRERLTDSISEQELANAMHVTRRTIYNWTHGKAQPNINDLILLAKFLHVDILELLVTKGQKQGGITDEELFAAHRRAETVPEGEREDSTRHTCTHATDFVEQVLFWEYRERRYHITTLQEFLLYWPLFDPLRLSDALQRIQDNWEPRPDYIFQQLESLYRGIRDKKALQLVEFYREFALRSPDIRYMTEKTQDAQKLDKFSRWKVLFNSPEIQAASDAYDEHLARLCMLLANWGGRYDSL